MKESVTKWISARKSVSECEVHFNFLHGDMNKIDMMPGVVQVFNLLYDETS